jgi:pimeloyl-ACP methyl ester carboxylesterase
MMRDGWIVIDGMRVHTNRWGTRTARPPVVLVHGLGGSTINWQLIGAPLAQRLDTEVIALDLPGFGRTRLPDDHHATVGANGQIVAALLGTLGPSTLIGNSMGGAITIGVAARYPDLIAGVVLVDPALPRRGRGARPSIGAIATLPTLAPRIGALVVAARTRPPAAVADATLRLVFHDPDRIDHDVLRRVARLGAERSQYPEVPRAFAEATRSLLAQSADPRALWRDMRAITAPVLVVQGRDDRLVPTSVVREAVRRREGWELEVFERCGHVPQLECPDRFVAVVAAWSHRVAAPQPHRGPVRA